MNSNLRLPQAPNQLQTLVLLAGIADQLVVDDHRAAPIVIRQIESVAGLRASVWLRDDESRLACAGAGHEPAVVASVEAELIVRLRTAHGEKVLLQGRESLELPGEEGHGVVLLPLRCRQRLTGVLAVTREPAGTPLTEGDLTFARAVADITSVALSHARMVRDTAVALEQSRRYSEVLDSISDAVVTCDLDGTIVNWNTGAEQIYRYSRGEALGCDQAALLGTQYFTDAGEPLDVQTVLRDITDVGHWQGELHQRNGEGRALTLLSAVTTLYDDHGQPDGVVAVNRDVTEQRRRVAQANHDPGTGLPNRQGLVTDLYDALARSTRTAAPLAVFVVGLDTDRDDLVRSVADRLIGTLRDADRVCRMSGTELAVIAERAGAKEDVANLAGRLGRAATAITPARVGLAYSDGSHDADTTPDQVLAEAQASG